MIDDQILPDQILPDQIVTRQVTTHDPGEDGQWYWERVTADGAGIAAAGYWDTELQAEAAGMEANRDLILDPPDPSAVTS